MQHSIRAIGAAALLAGGGLLAVVAANPARANTICEQYDKAVVGDGKVQYEVQNNRWNPDVTPQPPGKQCIDVTENPPGFKITAQPNSSPTNHGPVGYPSIYVGCHYNTCSPGTNLPMQVKSILKAESGIEYAYDTGSEAIFDASYDIWLDPQPKKDGVNEMEIMIWLNHKGPIQPIGQKVADKVTIDNHDWEVWFGNNDGNDVYSYVAPVAISLKGFNVLDFITDVRNRDKKVTDEWYLTSIQAGFEPWKGGVGLAIENFHAIVTPKTGLQHRRSR